MSDFFSDMQSVASEVLTEFNTGTLEYIEMQAVAGSTPDDPGEPVPVATTVKGSARPVSTKYVDGSHIVQSDIQVTIQAGVVNPDMDGFMDIDGTRYKIVEIMRKPAAGTPVAYTLIVRR